MTAPTERHMAEQQQSFTPGTASSEPQRSAFNLCNGTGWVCENHPNLAWGGFADGTFTCDCGAGMPCAGCISCPTAPAVSPLIAALLQYRDDLRYPPDADSIPRRLEMIDAALASAQAAK